MSFRIHKILGWGAKHPSENYISEEIFENTKNGEVGALIKAARDAAKESGDSYIDLHLNDAEFLKKSYGYEDYPKTFQDVMCYADYVDSPGGYWVIMPPKMSDKWYRRDDYIDYVESRAADGGADLNTHIQLLSKPIYPYSEWMDAVTGLPLKNFDPGYPSFGSDIEAEAVPNVPPCIRVIAEHLKFPDWKLFRPMLVTWWS